MNRKKFLKKSILGAIGVTAGSHSLKASNVKLKNSTYDAMMKQVGFNHLPLEENELNNELKKMKTVLHKANTRGHANHGWLDSHHSFSFARYYNPERMNFGVLRVLNDDMVIGGKGFSIHPHDNMEIISIPLEGDLEHKDSMGNSTVIKEGDVQVMSAGTGVYHSEYNKNQDKAVRFLQIWMFPNQKDVTPRYDQISYEAQKKKNEFTQILSPNSEDQGVWTHQGAWFNLGEFEAGCTTKYMLNDSSNGLYAFVIEGDVKIGDQSLEKRDGYGMWDLEEIELQFKTSSKVLLMEVPMEP